MHHWHVFDNMEQASRAAAIYIARIINQVISQRDLCHVALPGGTTPVRCLHYLSMLLIDWDKVHWYLGDERCYPVGHPERNDVMLQNNFWSLLTVAHVHRIYAELGAAQAAKIYQEECPSLQKLDLVFLGMGEDGHTASLFPGNAALESEQLVVSVHDSPKPPSERVSLGRASLRNAAFRVILAGGEEKQQILQRVKCGDVLPVNCIGDVEWFIDSAATQQGISS